MEKTATWTATGRRKTAVARVELVPGEGTWRVNRRTMEDYFSSEALRNYIAQPLQMTSMAGKVNVIASLTGGGLAGQAGALRHGISRALALSDQALRATLKSGGCLTRDSRMKERKKPGLKRARKAPTYTKR